MTTEKLTGKVAAILNDRQLAINLGTEVGISKGMKFGINEPISITDPDTNAILGSITETKLRVEVIEVHPKFCVARTYETYRSLNFTEALAQQFPGAPTYVKRIARESSEYDENSVTVSVGDVAVALGE